MFCASCGKELPDDAAFCIKCGKPQRAGVQAAQVQVEVPRWETCEIVYEVLEAPSFLFGPGRMQFWAKAIGPKGQYTAANSEVFTGKEDFPYDKNDKAVNALNVFIKNLYQDGWESTGSISTIWFNHRFRRRIK